MKYLLDTNILSELRKSRPNKNVLAFINNLPKDYSYISCITIGKIQKSIDSCQDSELKKRLYDWFELILIAEYQQQIINIDSQIMCRWGRLSAEVKNLPVIDSLIAATCLTHNLAIVTRNIKDFQRVPELEIVNPFEKGIVN